MTGIHDVEDFLTNSYNTKAEYYLRIAGSVIGALIVGYSMGLPGRQAGIALIGGILVGGSLPMYLYHSYQCPSCGASHSKRRSKQHRYCSTCGEPLIEGVPG